MFKAIGRYFKGVAYETSKVRWAKPKQIVVNTAIVLGYLVFFGILFWGLNAIILQMLKAIGLSI